MRYILQGRYRDLRMSSEVEAETKDEAILKGQTVFAITIKRHYSDYVLSELRINARIIKVLEVE